MIKILGMQPLQTYDYKPPGDKSISHRSAILGAISRQKLIIKNFANSKDCLSTLNCLRELGAQIDIDNDLVTLSPWVKAPQHSLVLDCGNSGTTARLLPAVLGGLNIEATITGDRSLSRRPMSRIVEPLKELGGAINSSEGKLPIHISKGWKLKGSVVKLNVASAQLKTALLLSGLFSQGAVTVIEPEQTRDHTEIMLKEFGVPVEKQGNRITVGNNPSLSSPLEYMVVGDFSSAVYFIGLGLLSKDKVVKIRNVGLNPTRTGFLEIIKQMGGSIKITERMLVNGELMGDIDVYPSTLKGIDICPKLVPNVIDELPLLAVLGAFAKGCTRVVKANELRVKESDRIKTIINCLKKLGANAKELEDGFEIVGGSELIGEEVYCQKDHRIIMSIAIASLFCEGITTITDSNWVDISNTSFFKELEKIAPTSII